MGAQVISLFQRPSPISDWSQQELAEFYRVENALLQAGMRIETDRGVTDDGEPWFAFCRQDDGEVFIHFARIGGQYIIAGAAYDGVIKGWDFASLVRELIARHPLVQMGPARKPSNIFMHPAALLIAVVGTAFFKTGEAKADDGDSRGDGTRRLMLSQSGSAPVVTGQASIAVEAHQTMMLVAAALAVAASDSLIALPASQAGWRMAHEALDYSASPLALTGAAPVSSLPLAGSPGPAIDQASARDVGDWLSLAVLLGDLAGPEPATISAFTPAINEVSGLLTGLPDDATQNDAAMRAEGPAQAPLMVVELAAGPLPDIAGVRLVRDMGLLDSSKVIRVTELPQFLADFVANGQRIVVTEEAAGAPAPEAPAADQPVESIAAPPEAPPAVDTEAKPDPAFVAPVSDTPVSPAPAAPSVMTDAQVKEMIGRFVESTPYMIVSDGEDLIFYDTRISDPYGHGSDTYTLVMTFDDGGTITLIGMAHDDYAFLLPGGG